MAVKMADGGSLVAIIADEDTITGFLLAGVGNIDLRRKSNFLVVDASAPPLRCRPCGGMRGGGRGSGG